MLRFSPFENEAAFVAGLDALAERIPFDDAERTLFAELKSRGEGTRPGDDGGTDPPPVDEDSSPRGDPPAPVDSGDPPGS